MGEERSLTAAALWKRIAVLLIAGVIIWKFIAYLSESFMGQEYNSYVHFILALVTAGLTLVLLQAFMKVDAFSWNEIGQKTVVVNIFSFILGFFLWVIPAASGLFICLQLGWVKIEVVTGINSLMPSLFVLLVTVFLIEALPEEFIFRGYIYRCLNALFPHWGTVILQAMLFSMFAYFIGAMYSLEQLQFLPGFAIILGIFRAISGSVWTSIGFHTAIMTATQALGTAHGHFDVDGISALRFFAFILLPSVIGSTVLSFIYSNHQWSKKESFHRIEKRTSK